MTAPPTYIKDPGATLDYGWDWTDWLAGDTITTSSWTVPAPLTASSPGADTTTTVVWIEGGVTETTYTVVNHIVTAAGREDDRTFYLAVREK